MDNRLVREELAKIARRWKRDLAQAWEDNDGKATYLAQQRMQFKVKQLQKKVLETKDGTDKGNKQ